MLDTTQNTGRYAVVPVERQVVGPGYDRRISKAEL